MFIVQCLQKEMLNEDLAFYQEQNEKNVQECESLRQNIESLEVSSKYVAVFCSSVVVLLGEGGNQEAVVFIV